LRRYTFLFCCLAITASNVAFAQAGYGGPAISGVPAASAGLKGSQTEGIKYFAAVSASYDSGLAPVSVNSNGDLISSGGLWGESISWGAYGTHRARRFMVGLNYIGSYRNFNNNKYYNGVDSVLALDISRELSNRLQWLAVTQAGSTSSSFGSWASYAGFLPGAVTPGVPVNDIYDNRNYFLAHTQTLTYLLSPRLSVTAGGTGTVVRRQSKALVGMDGYGALGSVAYRITQLSSVSLMYGWNHYDYPRQFGEADVHELMAGYTRQLSRRWLFSLGAGVFRAETQGLTQISVDPAVAALFGPGTITERYYREKYYPSISANLSGHYHHYTVGFSYSRRPSPGNGVFLASASQSGSASVSYTGVRKWNFGADVVYSQLSSVAQKIGNYSSVSEGGGVTYHLYRNLSATFRGDTRSVQINQSTGQLRASYRLSMGLALGATDLPLALW
jgi:hypothetical protein